MEKKETEKVNTKELNKVIGLSSKILNISYFAIIGIIIIAILLLIKHLNILTFIGGILRVISPLFIGFVIAWLFNPIVKWLQSKGITKVLSAIIVYVVFIIFLVLFIKLFIPVVYSQVNELLGSLPSIFTEIEKFVGDFIGQFQFEGVNLEDIKVTMVASLENTLLGFMNNLPKLLINFIGKLFSGLGTVLLGLIVGLYMLFDFESIQEHLLKLLPKKNREEIGGLLSKIGLEVRKTVNGTLLVACMVFVADSIGFTIIGLKAPLLFGLFCGITDLIPYIGPYLGGAAAVIVGFSQSNPLGIAALIIVVIVQLVESYILQPVVMSKAMQLHPVTIIVGLLIFGYFFGIIGMVLATPCLALLKVLWEFVKNKYKLFRE